ncbi:MAG: hypothetical protein R3F56_09020 [Planctomycetota bacterium]
MRSSLFAATAALFLSLPIAAQRGGMANRNTPTVTQSIAFTNGNSVEVKYRAITWAQGRWMNALKNEQGRETINNDLKANPTGSLTTAKDMTLGGQVVKAGDYKLYFQVDDEVKFHLVLADEAGTEIKWKLDLTETKTENTRLALTLTAGKGDNDANFGVAFGTMACSVNMLSTADKSAKEAAAPAKGDKGKDK